MKKPTTYPCHPLGYRTQRRTQGGEHPVGRRCQERARNAPSARRTTESEDVVAQKNAVATSLMRPCPPPRQYGVPVMSAGGPVIAARRPFDLQMTRSSRPVHPFGRTWEKET